MFQFKRNQVIVTVLVFMIATAAYLSLTETPANLSVPNINEATIPVADVGINQDFFDEYAVMETLPPDDMDAISAEVSVPDQAVSSKEVVIAKKQSDLEKIHAGDNKAVEVSYFAEEKMLREQSRASQIEQLTEYVADPNLDKDSKSKAAENLLTIQDRIEKETGAESLLRAKGFKDVFVRMDDDTVDVVVNKDNALTDEEIAQIEEIVQRKTGYTVGKIKISCLKIDKQAASN